MTVYRIHIRPGGGANNQEMSFEYCLNHTLLNFRQSLISIPFSMI